MKVRYIRSDGIVYVLIALSCVMLPVQWIWATAVAAAVHEAGHMLAVFICGGRIRDIYIRSRGAVIQSEVASPIHTLICSLAGPAASLCLACFMHRFPRTSFAALLQGLYNLLPVFPLDGGSAVAATAELLPAWDIKFLRKCIYASVVLLILAVSLRMRSLLVFLVLLPLNMEKYLAKKRKKGYNNATIEMR